MKDFLLVASDVHSDDEAFLFLSNLASKKNCLGFLYAGDIDLNNPIITLELANRNYAFMPVLGNCDSPWDYQNNNLPVPPISREYTYNNIKIGITHGHLYVPMSSCDIEINGHTHVCKIEKLENTVVLNPGSPSRPRGRTEKSYAVIEFNEDSVLISIRELYSEAEISSVYIPVKK